MDSLIYDRTQADVTYAQNNQSSNDFLKGAYNYTDLNRIEEWCEYIVTQLRNDGYSISLTTKTDWTMSDFPTQAQMERIRSNVATLKNLYNTLPNVPTTLNKMTWQKANDIEKILDNTCNSMVGMQNWYVYSGVSHAGQPRLWQHRFRQFYHYPTVGGNYLTLENGEILTTENGAELEVEE